MATAPTPPADPYDPSGSAAAAASQWTKLMTDAIDLWASCAKKTLDLYTVDPTSYAGFSTILDDVSKLWLEWAKIPVGASTIRTTSLVRSTAPPVKTKVDIPAQKSATGLRATAFVDASGGFVPDSFVTVAPATVAVGQPVQVEVTIALPINNVAGKYCGAIVDDNAMFVVDRVEVQLPAT